MLKIFILFYLFIRKSRSEEITESTQPSSSLKTGLVPKTNFVFKYKNVDVPCLLVESQISSDVTFKVSNQNNGEFIYMLESEIREFASRNTNFETKIDYILQQLESYPPDQIDILIDILKIVETNEKIETKIKKYFPPFLFIYRLYSKMLTFEFDFKYKYYNLFEAYHDAFKHSKTNRPLLAKGRIPREDEFFVPKVTIADESPDDIYFRCRNQIRSLINNWAKAKLDYEDPLLILSLNCIEFNNSCDVWMNQETEIEQKNTIEKERNLLFNEIDFFLSHLNSQEYYNIQGITVKILMRTYIVPKKGSEKILALYLSKDEFSSLLMKLPDEKINYFELLSTGVRAINLFANFKSGIIKTALTTIISETALSSLHKSYDNLHIPEWSQISNKINSVASKIGLNWESEESAKQIDSINDFKNKENEKIMLKKQMKEVRDIDGLYLVKIEVHSENKYVINLVPFF